MKVFIEPNKNNIAFKSGYPTFGANGHLNYNPNISEYIYIGFRPSGPLKKGIKLDYYA